MKKYYVYNDCDLSTCYWTYSYDTAVAFADLMVDVLKNMNKKYFDDFPVVIDNMGKVEGNLEDIHVWITDRQDLPFWRNMMEEKI